MEKWWQLSLHAVSTMKGVTYWSVTRGKRQVLFLQSFVVGGPSNTDALPDPVFTEVPAVQEIFTFQEDNSFGKNTYTERFVSRADHLLVKTENLTAIKFLFIPVIQPGNKEESRELGANSVATEAYFTEPNEPVEIARLLVVVQDHLLVELSQVGHQEKTSVTFRIAATSASISSRVL